jgi:hypothetical protein
VVAETADSPATLQYLARVWLNILCTVNDTLQSFTLQTSTSLSPNVSSIMKYEDRPGVKLIQGMLFICIPGKSR